MYHLVLDHRPSSSSSPIESSAGDSSESAGMVERIESLRLENLKVRAMLDIEKDRRSMSRQPELETRLSTRGSSIFNRESHELGNGNDNGGGDGNGNGNGNGTGNGNNRGDNGDGDENRNMNGRGDRHVALEIWSEKIETRNYYNTTVRERYQVKKQTVLNLDSALTWWNSHKRTIGTDAAYALSWRELLKLMIEVYCPRNETQKMETEL
ncbi:hypothetical protein Tco_0639910 [Tanacetum coccineum]